MKIIQDGDNDECDENDGMTGTALLNDDLMMKCNVMMTMMYDDDK